MLAGLENFARVVAVARRVGRDKDRFDGIVFNHLFERFVSLFALARFCETVAAFREEIADGDDFDVRVILQAELRAKLAQAESDDTHFELLVGKRFPFGVGVDVGVSFVKSLNIRFLRFVGKRAAKRDRRGAQGACR